MRKYLFLAIAACAALAACNKEQSAEPEKAPAAKLRLSIASAVTKADFQTADEATVGSFEVFVFNGNMLDAYHMSNSSEAAAGIADVDCTQGTRDIWVIVNGPGNLSAITTKSALKAKVSQLVEDNATDEFTMVGKAESQNVTASFSKTINVDRIASRVRLFQIRREMTSQALSSLPSSKFKIIRAYMTNVIDNACFDVFTPIHPSSYIWYAVEWGPTAIKTNQPLVYKKLATAYALEDDSTYGTAYADESTVAPFTFYVYPNEFDSRGTSPDRDQLKLVVECQIDGQFYTYPIPLGAVSYNKSYDVKMLTITRLGNSSDGDDDVDDGEDDIITPATASFTITVNDWTQVLNFGGVSGGEIEI